MADLRIALAKRGAKIQIRINGRSHTAYEGESVHAALLAAGYRVLRTTAKEGQPRGFFCGMGICYECLVTINGIPNKRACMTLVADQMEITIDV
jgi:D-hydroxyproline dehydrogenase subunit gamma